MQKFPQSLESSKKKGDENESETDHDQQAYVPPDQIQPMYEQENMIVAPEVPIRNLNLLKKQ